MKVQHVAQASVCQRRAKHWNIVLPCPVVDGSLVVDLLAQTVDDFAWCPVQWLVCLLTCLLLLQHLVQDRHYPVLERAVVAVRDDKITDAVHALRSQPGAGSRESAEVGWRKTFDEVFFNTACSCHDGRDVFVLDQVP